MCLKIHSDNLHATLCGIFAPNSVNVARYASLIGIKSPTKCDAQLAESNFQTHSSLNNKKMYSFLYFTNTTFNCQSYHSLQAKVKLKKINVIM